MSSGARVVETIWSKIERDPSLVTAAAAQAGAGAADAVSSETTTLIVGNAGSGKSTLINSAFKASSSKQPRPTFALEYTFARKKVGSGTAAGKSVAHVWELGGSIDEPKLLNVPITARNVASASIIICIDLSEPKNILSSARRWVRALKEMCQQVLGDARVTAMSDAAKSRFRNDLNKIYAFPIPLCFIGTKYDKFRDLPPSDRKAALLILRFVAHFFGASLYCTSSNEATTRDSFKGVFSSLCFGGSAGRVNLDASLDNPWMVPAGADSFQDILLGGASTGIVEASKTRLVGNEAEMLKLIGPPTEGLPNKCWSRIEEFSKNIFGEPDVVKKDIEAQVGGADNMHPEPEIDAKRAEKDAELVKYIQDVERREILQARMAAQDGGEEGGEVDDAAAASAAAAPRARKSRSGAGAESGGSTRSSSSSSSVDKARGEERGLGGGGEDDGEQKTSRSSRK